MGVTLDGAVWPRGGRFSAAWLGLEHAKVKGGAGGWSLRSHMNTWVGGLATTSREICSFFPAAVRARLFVFWTKAFGASRVLPQHPRWCFVCRYPLAVPCVLLQCCCEPVV